MVKLAVIRKLASQIQAQTYLEIGVRSGRNIVQVPVRKKFGVDPEPVVAPTLKLLRHFGARRFRLFKVTSDAFFAQHAGSLLKEGLDLALVDGLHTYRQALKDTENTLEYLNDTGFIILHDCNPASALHAYPVRDSMDELDRARSEHPDWNWPWGWNGDVWKAIWHLRCTRPELSVFTLNCDYGLGVVSRHPGLVREQIAPELSDIRLIDQADYQFLSDHREQILNLKPAAYLSSILTQL